MRIAIEAQRIFRKDKHGMDFVALEMLRELQQIDHENEYYVFVSPGEDRCLESTPHMKVVELHMPSYPLWEQVALPLAVRKCGAELLHCTSNTAPVFSPVPLIVTLHDIIFLEKRHGTTTSWYQKMGWYYRRWNVPRILPSCRKVITVSHFERDNILRATGLAADKVQTVYNGYSQHFRHHDDWQEVVGRYTREKSFFFFLGNTDPKKNTRRVLQAYGRYVQNTISPCYLMVADLSAEDIEVIVQQDNLQHIRPYLIIPGYIPNTDLPYIYSAARAFLYPSLRESFGIPLLEAMACGTPVLSSDTSAIPEIAADAAILVDPTNVEAMAAELLRLDKEEAYRRELITRGYNRCCQFSWRRTAEEVRETYCLVHSS